MYAYGSFVLRFDRKQQNSVKVILQLKNKNFFLSFDGKKKTELIKQNRLIVAKSKEFRDGGNLRN